MPQAITIIRDWERKQSKIDELSDRGKQDKT
jgi:hypothetical protein